MLKDFLPSCLVGRKNRQETKNATRKKTSELYNSSMGKILIGWSHFLAGLLIAVEIPSENSSSWFPSFIYSGLGKQDPFFSFKIYPDEKKGLRRFRTKKGVLEFAWDFTKAKFCASLDAQPESGYFLSIILNGQMILLVGDLKDEAYRFTKARKSSNAFTMISREDTVDLKGQRKYSTNVLLGDEEEHINVASVNISHGKAVAMKIYVGSKKIIDVSSVWDKIHGSKRFVLGEEILDVSWNRLEWIPPKTKFMKNKVAPKKDEMMKNAEYCLPAIVVDFCYTRKDGLSKQLSFAIKLISG